MKKLVDLMFPMKSQTSVKVVKKPFLTHENKPSKRAYDRPVNIEFFDQPDSENFLIHIVGLLSAFMNLRLLRTYKGHPLKRMDAEYLDLDTSLKIRVEWELVSSNFLAHGHSPKMCELIMCWKDNLTPNQFRKMKEENPNLEVMDVSKVLHHYEFVKTEPS